MTSVTDLGATLANVLSDLGPDWLESRARLLATLRETVPGETRAVHVLMAAFDAGVPGRLAAADGPASDVELGRETARLVDDFGSGPEHARAAVETWATALGRMSRVGPLAPDALPAPTDPAPVPSPSPAKSGPIQSLPAAPTVVVQPPPRPPPPPPRAALPGAQPKPGAARPVRSGGKAWIFIVPGLALAAGGLWWIGSRPQAPTPPTSRVPAAPSRETPGSSGSTDDGFAIATPTNPPAFPAKRLDGDPNTILFSFGLRFGAETYTYQAAAAFAGASPDGVGLIKAFKSGREASTAQLKVSRAIQSNGYLGFTVAGSFANSPIAAPPICVSALAGRSDATIDIRNGGGTFCAFGVTASGLCDGDRKLGCGDLTP